MRDATENRKALVVCGPTAGGKSVLSDRLAGYLSARGEVHAPVIVVDSMQVYREIPRITNQDRERPAELRGVVSVSEEWNMARHRDAAEAIICATNGPFVIDAGTGMYLNAILLDIPIFRRVDPEIRRKAAALARDAVNSRRATRDKELELSGETRRGSIWAGTLRYDVAMIYVRPERFVLDNAIEQRSAAIARNGVAEAANLVRRCDSGELTINPSVREAIGVRELMGLVRGRTKRQDAENEISCRTRQLARRQMRWFDKLARGLGGKARVLQIQDARSQNLQDLLGKAEMI